MQSFLAVLCVLTAALAWQSFIVNVNYQGNWTALFCSGDHFTTPSALAGEHVYRFANSNGYDGQFYHDVAHDPLMRRDLYRYTDAPSIRYDRILVPGLASLVAFGADARVDSSYFAIVLLFAGLGAWWLARYAAQFGRSPHWGTGFLLVPAVLTSLDRMVVDVALAALCLGWVWYGIRERRVASWLVLAAAALARETGLILVGAQVIWYWWNSRFRRSLAMATSALPALLWRFYVAQRVPASHLETAHLFPFSGIVVRFFHPNHYAMPSPILMAATLTDYLALGGILVAVGFGSAGSGATAAESG